MGFSTGAWWAGGQPAGLLSTLDSLWRSTPSCDVRQLVQLFVLFTRCRGGGVATMVR